MTQSQDHLVDIHTTFYASSAELESLYGAVLEAISQVVCPPDPARLLLCDSCDGTAIITSDGTACTQCADTPHPGRMVICARAHVDHVQVHAPGASLSDPFDHHLRDLLLRLRGAAASGTSSIVTAIDDELRRLSQD